MYNFSQNRISGKLFQRLLIELCSGDPNAAVFSFSSAAVSEVCKLRFTVPYRSCRFAAVPSDKIIPDVKYRAQASPYRDRNPSFTNALRSKDRNFRFFKAHRNNCSVQHKTVIYFIDKATQIIVYI